MDFPEIFKSAARLQAIYKKTFVRTVFPQKPSSQMENLPQRFTFPPKPTVPEWTCVLCDEISTTCGNLPSPLAEEGKCCDKCNETKVLPARFAKVLPSSEPEPEPEYRGPKATRFNKARPARPVSPELSAEEKNNKILQMTAEIVYSKLATSGYDFKGAFDQQVPAVQAIMLDMHRCEKIYHYQNKREWEERQREFEFLERRWNIVDAAFIKIQGPQPEPTEKEIEEGPGDNSYICSIDGYQKHIHLTDI